MKNRACSIPRQRESLIHTHWEDLTHKSWCDQASIFLGSTNGSKTNAPSFMNKQSTSSTNKVVMNKAEKWTQYLVTIARYMSMRRTIAKTP
mmetsp:Transcript_96677/g.181780  ORF Transcript_96677/g.181780 Transcript_96677/m.181780 type:complete len:91 (+) Transcript_96677:46-318(+)